MSSIPYRGPAVVEGFFADRNGYDDRKDAGLMITIERILLAYLYWQLPSSWGQSSTYRPPRAGRQPDSTVWQVLNEANYDLRATARGLQWHSAPVRTPAGGAGFGVGSGWRGAAQPRVVEGGEIPYKPEALKQKQENQELADPRSEIKCYLPGGPRATYMPQLFRILQRQPDLHRLPVCRRGP